MSTCDHICRECGQVMSCQHCKPWQLPADRARIAELEIDRLETMLRERAGIAPDHLAAPLIRAMAEAFVEYGRERAAAENEACEKLAEQVASRLGGHSGCTCYQTVPAAIRSRRTG